MWGQVTEKRKYQTVPFDQTVRYGNVGLGWDGRVRAERGDQGAGSGLVEAPAVVAALEGRTAVGADRQRRQPVGAAVLERGEPAVEAQHAPVPAEQLHRTGSVGDLVVGGHRVPGPFEAGGGVGQEHRR